MVSSLIYVVLMSYHKISAWHFAAISSGIYVYICYNANLYLDATLQIFYVFMAVYGWYSWNSNDKKLKFKTFPLKTNILLIVLGVFTSVILGWLFSTFTRQYNPFLDAGIFVFSIITTYLASISIIENWLFWILIDLLAMYVFGSRELYLTAVLYLIYSLMAAFGYINWIKLYKKQ